MQEAIGSSVWNFFSRHSGDGIRAPVGAQVGEDLRGVCEEMAEEHGGAIESIVLGGDNVRRAASIPVEGRIEDGLEEIAIWHVVGPLALALESRSDGMVALRLLSEAQLGKLGVADHEIAGDERHFHACLPLGVELLARAFLSGRVPILALFAMGLHPFEGFGELDFVVDASFDAANELGHVHRLDPHTEPFFEE